MVGTFVNLGFEEAGATEGQANGWTYDFVSQAERLADYEPNLARPWEDFERGWPSQFADVRIVTVAAVAYGVTINGEDHKYVAGGGDNLDSIRTGVVDAVNAGSQPVIATPVGRNGMFILPTHQTTIHTIVAGNLELTVTIVDLVTFLKSFADSVAASITSSNVEAYTLSDGQTLTVSIDGGSVQTVTFNTGEFVDIANATAEEVAAVINAELAAGTGSADTPNDRAVRIISPTLGAGSSVEVTGGTANPAFGFSTTPIVGLGNLDFALYDTSSAELFEDFEEQWDTNEGYLFALLGIALGTYDGGAFIEAGNAETYALQDADTLLVDVDGGGAAAVTFNTGEFADISNATAEEVAAVITSELSGAFADTIDAGTRVRIISEAHGGSASIEVTGGTAATVFNFPAGAQSSAETPEPVEDFEEDWDTNESYLFAFAGPELTFASYDSGAPEDVEDFEEEWDSNENYVFSSPPLSFASYDAGGTPEDVEDFEETNLDVVITVTPASDVISTGATVHGLSVNDPVSFLSTGRFPGGIQPDPTPYFVLITPTTTSFTIAPTVGGPVVDITDVGTGVHKVKYDRTAFWTEELAL